MSARREEILDAACGLADERGLAAVSMRAVAERVGLTPMALYPHVGDKAGLLDAMVGRLLLRLYEEAAPADGPDAGWRERLAAFARTARAMAVRHPWAAGLLFSRPAVTPDAVRAVDVLYQSLLEAGVPPAEVPRVERLVSTFVVGWAASEAGGRFGPGTLDPRGRRGRLPEGTLPGHAAVSEWLDRPVDWEVEFEADLADVQLMIESVVSRSRRGAPH